MADETVGHLAELYLGNILYAIEVTALSLDGQGKPEDAAFYRGIARKLAEAHGRPRDAERGTTDATPDVRNLPERGVPRGAY